MAAAGLSLDSVQSRTQYVTSVPDAALPVGDDHHGAFMLSSHQRVQDEWRT